MGGKGGGKEKEDKEKEEKEKKKLWNKRRLDKTNNKMGKKSMD
jgi:hypothetical protein